jgi:hypothetical protein
MQLMMSLSAVSSRRTLSSRLFVLVATWLVAGALGLGCASEEKPPEPQPEPRDEFAERQDEAMRDYLAEKERRRQHRRERLEGLGGGKAGGGGREQDWEEPEGDSEPEEPAATAPARVEPPPRTPPEEPKAQEIPLHTMRIEIPRPPDLGGAKVISARVERARDHFVLRSRITTLNLSSHLWDVELSIEFLDDSERVLRRETIVIPRAKNVWKTIRGPRVGEGLQAVRIGYVGGTAGSTR